MGDVGNVGDGEDEVELALRNGLPLCLGQLLILFLDLLHFSPVLFLDLLLAVSDYDDICVAGVHLIEGVHHNCEGITTQNKQNNSCLQPSVALDKGYGTVLHFACSQGLSMDIVELFYFQGSLFGNCHRFTLA